MAKKCYFVTYTNCAGASGTAYLCSADLAYLAGGSCGGGYFSSSDLGYNAGNASERSGSVTEVSCSNCPGCCVDPTNPNQPFDCLNGGCIPQITYKTPGVYASLSDCQSGCAKNSDCQGECVSKDQMIQLQQATDLITSRLCG